MRIILIILLFSQVCFSQELKIKNNQSGIISLGLRNTISTFSHGNFGNTGMGLGGQFRVQLADKVNTDWFFDYITGDVGDFAKRTDYHIGWSVLFYPGNLMASRFRPYILAGHCFDYTKLSDNSNRNNFVERWSSAVQAGAGLHFNLTQRLDMSFVTQYMIHLGSDIHADFHDDELHFHQEKGASLEGHLLFNLSINYKIADLW